MSNVEHFFEPERLILVWHHSNDDKSKTHRVVGEITRDDNKYTFSYLKGSPDFDKATDEGFYGFPAFSLEDSSSENALEIFLRRLPPRKREDFKDYLAQYNLPSDFSGSDFSLLAYTGAKLASDSFSLCPDVSTAHEPVDFVIDAIGLHHYDTDFEELRENDEIKFEAEPDNVHDSNAIKLIHHDQKIGYVNRALAPSLKKLLSKKTVTGSILKKSIHKDKVRLKILARVV